MVVVEVVVVMVVVMLLTCAVGEVVVSVRALVTVEAVVVWFTWTLTTADLTDLTLSTVHVTLTRYTAWIAVVSHIAPGTTTPPS